MLKKFVSLAVGTACLFSMVGVSAMSVTTSTEYRESDIKVETTVSDENLDKTMLTYLAFKGEPSDASNIVYVDQIIADSNTETFSYITQYSNIGSTVKVGGRDSEGTALTPNESDGSIGEIEGVPVTVDGVLATNVSFTAESNEDGLVKIVYAGIADDVIVGLQNDGTAVENDDYFIGSNCIWVKSSILDTDKTLNVITESVEQDAQTIALGYIPANEFTSVTETENSVIAVGKVLGDVDEFGIIYSVDNSFSNYTNYSDIDENTEAGDIAFPALGKGTNGLFAVEVFNVNNFIGTGNTVYAAAYYRVGETYELCSAPLTIAINGDVSDAVYAGASFSMLSVDEYEEVVEDEAIIFDVVEEDNDDVIDFIELDEVIEVEEIEEVDVIDIVE